MQYADEIDNSIGLFYKLMQHALVKHIGLDDLHRRQYRQMPGTRKTTGRHGNLATRCCELCHQVAADEAAATNDENRFVSHAYLY